MTKKFKVEPFKKDTDGTLDKIKPSKFLIPNWYRNIPKSIDGNNNIPITSDSNPNRTVKSCIPFLDAMSFGYMITLPYDIFITKDKKYQYMINWQTDYEVVSLHQPMQFDMEKVPDEFEKILFKWNNPWITKTPNGWSTLFIHPLNRIDLPFLTLSGIVDTDIFDIASVNFPFFLKKNFEGIIKNGTPIAQAIPIKRDSWEIEHLEYSGIENKTLNYLRKFISDSYKKQFWIKKDFS